MKTQANIIIAALCTLAGCGGGEGTPAPAVTTPLAVAQVRAGAWVVIGSSTAAGAGAPTGRGWVDQVAASLVARGATFVNLAKGGSVTYHGLPASASPVAGRPAPDAAANIDQALARAPVVLIISYPTNDTALGYSADETVANILAIRARAMAAAVPVLITSTQPRTLNAVQLAQLREIDQRLSASVGPCFVSLHSALAGPDGKLAAAYDAGDGVHPNEAGHGLIASKVQEIIAKKQCLRVLPE